MTELLTIITIETVLLGLAVTAHETITMWLHRRKLDRFAQAQRNVAELLGRKSAK